MNTKTVDKLLNYFYFSGATFKCLIKFKLRFAAKNKIYKKTKTCDDKKKVKKVQIIKRKKAINKP